MRLFFSINAIFWANLAILAAVEIRVATFNIRLGLDDSSIPNRSATRQTIARIDADVVGLQEVNSNDLTNDQLDEFASELGYPHVFVPVTALDTTSRVVFFSKFPFVPNSQTSILSPPGANDVTRAAAAVVVDVPGTDNDPTIVNAHLKCCLDRFISPEQDSDLFRRAVEMKRIKDYLESRNLGPSDNVIVMGDLNLLGTSNITYPQIPPGLPVSFQLGSDITFPFTYFINPVSYFPGLGINDPDSRQQDGITTDTFRGSSTVLDYLLISDALASRSPATEVYNSNLESSFAGLPKSGSPLAAVTSADASDHFPVFGDFQLDDGSGLSISSSEPTLAETSAPATLTVTLDSPATSATTITLQIDDPSEATLGDTSLTVPIGQTTATTTLTPLLDRIADGSQMVVVSASAAGFSLGTVGVNVLDADPTLYRFVTPGQAVIEDFSNFEGQQKPAAWTDDGITWQGLDSGNNTLLGGRSYEESLGIFSGSPTTFQASFRNSTGSTIQALGLSYLARHWRRTPEGSADELQVSVIRNGETTPLPGLTFRPNVEGPGGALSPPDSAVLSSYLRGLDLLPGEQIQLSFELLPGSPATGSDDDVFINEFHYDNSGQDSGEFVEVHVGPGYSGLIENIAIVLYNGNNGQVYGAPQPLNSFLVSTTPDGRRFFHKSIAPIQNGSPDGIALTIDGEVKEFISYEGAFTATNGPALGQPSTDIGVSQNSVQPNQNSIARTGTGSNAADLTWGIQPGSFTRGQSNVGQSFGSTPQPQGLAIDNLVVEPLVDTDGDLLPDIEETALGTNPLISDSDYDGQSDSFELLLAGTDPLSFSSGFRPTLSENGAQMEVSFPSLPDRAYIVEVSNDLVGWTPQPPLAGTGDLLSLPLPPGDTVFFRVRISIP